MGYIPPASPQVMYKANAPKHFRHRSLRAKEWTCAALTWSRDNEDCAWRCDDCGYMFGKNQELIVPTANAGLPRMKGPIEQYGADVQAKERFEIQTSSVGEALAIQTRAQADWPMAKALRAVAKQAEQSAVVNAKLVEKLRNTSIDVCSDCAAEFCFDHDEPMAIFWSRCPVCPTGMVCHKCAPRHKCFVNGGEFTDTGADVLAPRKRTVVFDD